MSRRGRIRQRWSRRRPLEIPASLRHPNEPDSGEQRMGIKPENKGRYPKNWKDISLAIRARSGGRCECHGECGLHRTTGGPRRCVERNGEPAKWAKGKVVLTVAHLNHQP